MCRVMSPAGLEPAPHTSCGGPLRGDRRGVGGRGVRKHARAREKVRAAQEGERHMHTHLARVRVDDAHVALALGAHQHDLLHVLAPDVEVVLAEVLLADLVEKLDDAAQQLLRDALAGAVDAQLHRRRRVEHGRGKHRHADRLAEAPRRADEHLLREVVPRVLLQHLLVRARKAAERLHLPEGARARLQKVLVEEALVEAAVPARGVEKRQRIPALAHAHDGRLFPGLQRGALLRRANACRERRLDSLALVRADLCGQSCREGLHEVSAGRCFAGLHGHLPSTTLSEIVQGVFIQKNSWCGGSLLSPWPLHDVKRL